MKITQKIKELLQIEGFRFLCILVAVIILAVIFANKMLNYQEQEHRAHLAERELNDSLRHANELYQTHLVDSISVVFMKSWAKVKNTEPFKYCNYYRYAPNWDTDSRGFLRLDFVKADVSCGEIKDLPDIGNFKPTAMVPGSQGEAMTVIYKFFPNK